jgi:predicted ATPase
MTDQRNILQNLFLEENRYTNFGSVLMFFIVMGFRCHTTTIIEIESPITAYCGLNGTGKSTLLQLAAAAYKKPSEESHRYYIKDFIVSGTLDPTPFLPDASVLYGYWQENRTIKKVIITRSDPEKRWQGYKKQPSRYVYFAGMGLYLPKIEVRDFVVRNASKITVTNTEPLPERSKQCACKILGCSYESMDANTVNHAGRTGKVVTVMRSAKTYSEANMGCGEGRVQHIVRVLETIPEKSLVLLEEPETSLHPSAQHEFGKYLIDVCIKRRHQIFITTHSEYLLTALPSSSRIYVDRTASGLRLVKGITTAQAISLMSGGYDKALYILVEDKVADIVLTEILRKSDSTFLKTIKIHQIGDTKTIQSVMKALKETGLPVAAVRDGDKGENPQENMFKLPGNLPPEKELFNCAKVKEFLKSEFNIDVDDFLVSVRDDDHGEWFKRLSERIPIDEVALIQQTAKVYVGTLSENEVDALVKPLKAAIRI